MTLHFKFQFNLKTLCLNWIYEMAVKWHIRHIFPVNPSCRGESRQRGYLIYYVFEVWSWSAKCVNDCWKTTANNWTRHNLISPFLLLWGTANCEQKCENVNNNLTIKTVTSVCLGRSTWLQTEMEFVWNNHKKKCTFFEDKNCTARQGMSESLLVFIHSTLLSGNFGENTQISIAQITHTTTRSRRNNGKRAFLQNRKWNAERKKSANSAIIFIELSKCLNKWSFNVRKLARQTDHHTADINIFMEYLERLFCLKSVKIT